VSRLVTLHAWRVPGTALPRALWRMAVDRRRLAGTDGVSFAKLLGTGRDLAFGPAAADPTRWAAVVGWDDPAAADRFDDSPVGQAWQAVASAHCRLALRPLTSRGRWAGHEPFQPDPRPVQPDPRPVQPDPRPVQPDPRSVQPAAHDGPVLVLTRARLRPAQAARFWRTIPSVARTLPDAPGLLAAFGFGEAPLGWQGTVSVWRATADLVGFAYRRPEHRAVVAATPVRRWYAEELFARFAVLGIAGDRGVLGWVGRDDPG
jgi:hypothetical protein